jgi:hypothetical protein
VCMPSASKYRLIGTRLYGTTANHHGTTVNAFVLQ